MSPQSPGKTVVLGVGNLLLSDEGFGVHVIQRLQARYHLPAEVQVVDGGTLGLDLLYYLDGASRLVIIDAVEADEEPGTVVRLEGEEVPSFLSIKMSPHQVGVTDMLFAAKLRDLYPQTLVLWGVQPQSLDLSLELSPPVAAQLDLVVEQVVADLLRWGVPVQPQPEDADAKNPQGANWVWPARGR